jgi:ParB family chromosome partitioning protein
MHFLCQPPHRNRTNFFHCQYFLTTKELFMSKTTSKPNAKPVIKTVSQPVTRQQAGNTQSKAGVNAIDVSGSKSVYKRFGDLFLSNGNVRQGEVSDQGIAELAAMIGAQGLLNALQVSAELDEHGKPTGRSGVEAGGRRYRALALMHRQGKINDDTLIECKELSAGRACEVSLAENLGQQAMHPADEYAAFQTLVDGGSSVEVVAAKFGVSVVHVLRRLKMAKVAPELVALYRSGELTLDHIQALACIDDQERQMQIWNGLPQWSRSAQSIKRKLTEEEISATDARVKLIGLSAYLAAGGTVREDLFSEDDDKYLTDLGLVEMMVGEAMQGKVEELQAEGWVWVETLQEYGYEERMRFCEAPKVYLPETPEQVLQREALETQMHAIDAKRDALYDLDEDEDENVEASDSESTDDKIDKLDDAYAALEARIAALSESRLDTAELDKSVLGAIVVLGEDGLEVKRGLMVREAGNGVYGSGAYKAPVKVKAEVPEKLMQNLTSCKTAAIQALMLSNESVTLAALAHTLAVGLFGHGTFECNVKITMRECRSDLERNAPDIGEAQSLKQVDAARSAWSTALPKDKAQWFAWFLEQPQERVLSFIVFATALSTDAITGTMDRISRATPLAQALHLDMAQWWQPTAQSYFGLVPKAKMADAVREVAGEKAAGELLKLKSAGAVAHAVKHTQDKGWLPVPLRSVTVPLLSSAEVCAQPGHDAEAQATPQEQDE